MFSQKPERKQRQDVKLCYQYPLETLEHGMKYV